MKKYILISLAAIILSFTSCVKPEEGGKDNPQPPTPAQEQITIPSTVDVKPVVSPEGGDTKISFTAASAWTASVISTKADSWVDVNPKSGDPGTAEIAITTTPNDTYVERNATIQIKCGAETKDIVLTQKQQDNVTVTTDKVELGVEGGSFTIELKSNIDFSYEIDGDWIKYVSTKAYTDKTLTFSAEPNEGVQKREGSVTVKGGEFSETIKVYQTGEEPTLVISQNEYNLEAEGGSIVVEVSSNVAVTMTIPEDVLWITENQTKSVSTSTFHLDIATNETTEARSAEITFSNEETGLCETITVYQAGEELTLVISQNEYNLEAEGGSITVEVSSNLAVTMTIPEDALWITENKTKSVSTSIFQLNIAANKTAEARSAEITFSNEESGLSEKVIVNQEGNGSINVPEIVDLGLSVKWASFNVGASKPEEYGGHYQWAGLEDVTSTDIYLGWDNCPYHTGSDRETGWTKYVPSYQPSFWSGTGSPDNKTLLDPEDDVAHVTLGDKWRMPTGTEFDELINNCTWTWTQINGVNGYKVTSNKSGYSDKWIFLPAAGFLQADFLSHCGTYGNYVASSLGTHKPFFADALSFFQPDLTEDAVYVGVYPRCDGASVRPVYGDKIRATGVSLEPISLTMDVGETYILSASVIPSNAVDKGVEWFSSNTDVATVHPLSGKVTAVKAGSATITVRTTDGGYTASCSVTVSAKTYPVTGVSLEPTSISLNVGEKYTLSATVTPSNATDKTVRWTSSDTDIATVDHSGEVTGVREGSTTITVTTTDGGYTATCSVTVENPGTIVVIATPDAVDLGLSVKWASFNLGASSPEEYGGYYQWAGLEDVTSHDYYLDWSNCPYHIGSDENTGWTKYVDSSHPSYWSGPDSPDNKTVLGPEDDIAHVTLGENWRMPTSAEWKELKDYCIWDWTQFNGVYGYKVTSNKSGYTDEWIFLPAAGSRYYYDLSNIGPFGSYCTSSLSSYYPCYAYCMYFNVCLVVPDCNYNRYEGLSVRPVSE